ncbi:helix-turn-helix domain-containing protein [Mycoplasma phocoenae]|uniref:Helix-turn-helix transcriptional regulator n=1 Tax=Mycoplasma phocoenae TaxID=754517 RepID=A0A858U736_9MOLU|nr:helix-turn-helix transcriptional regulator [Mycoplasma phocoenae]QJG67257.1 helix-turn-helix transcriptional regulator [Mycoplasma phocoenae]
MKIKYENFSDELKELLAVHEMSQKELALRLGLSLKHMNSVLNNDIKEITVKVLRGIEDAFHLKAGALSETYYSYTDLMKTRELGENVNLYLKEYGVNFLINNPQLSYPFDIYIREDMTNYEKLMCLKRFYGVSNLEDYKTYLDNHILAELKKYREKPNTYVWIRFCELGIDHQQSVGTFRSNQHQTTFKKSLNIMEMNIPFIEKIQKLKKFLLSKGIVLVTKSYIEGSMINGITLKKGAKRFIFLSDMSKLESRIFFTLLHEIAHCYFPKKTEDEIDAYVVHEHNKWMKTSNKNNYLAIYDAIEVIKNIQIQTKRNPGADVSILWDRIYAKYPNVIFDPEQEKEVINE